MHPTLICCVNGNKRLAGIAKHAGFKLGAQLPHTVYFDLFFADQDWKKPNRQAYMKALQIYKPSVATVLDWERQDQLPEVLDWAEEAAQYIDKILLIPKVQGGIDQLPRHINGKDVVLAYSVPTKFGGTALSPNQFAGWPIHLLGGSPHTQMKLYRGWFRHIADVVSVDGNMHNRMATQHCKYWQGGKWIALNDGHDDTPYRAFQKSCENIMEAWKHQW
jgi:hypothetical protein